jgi:hypothetical protein
MLCCVLCVVCCVLCGVWCVVCGVWCVGNEGNGWLKEVRGNGVRGYIDRRHLRYPETWTPPKRKWKRGSLHLTKFILYVTSFKFKP